MITDELRLEALQRAYNGICGVLASISEAGLAKSSLFNDAETVRAQLARLAFPQA